MLRKNTKTLCFFLLLVTLPSPGSYNPQFDDPYFVEDGPNKIKRARAHAENYDSKRWVLDCYFQSRGEKLSIDVPKACSYKTAKGTKTIDLTKEDFKKFLERPAHILSCFETKEEYVELPPNARAPEEALHALAKICQEKVGDIELSEIRVTDAALIQTLSTSLLWSKCEAHPLSKPGEGTRRRPPEAPGRGPAPA